jgi:hypothetical protein
MHPAVPLAVSLLCGSLQNGWKNASMTFWQYRSRYLHQEGNHREDRRSQS